jgi:hypothetical protein
MLLKKNTLAGKNNFKLILFFYFFYLSLITNSFSESNLEVYFTDIKILDKISSKNKLVKLKNGEPIKFNDLIIYKLKIYRIKIIMRFLFLMTGCSHQVLQ